MLNRIYQILEECNHKAFIIDKFDNKIIAKDKEDIDTKLVERMFRNE